MLVKDLMTEAPGGADRFCGSIRLTKERPVYLIAQIYRPDILFRLSGRIRPDRQRY